MAQDFFFNLYTNVLVVKTSQCEIQSAVPEKCQLHRQGLSALFFPHSYRREHGGDIKCTPL